VRRQFSRLAGLLEIADDQFIQIRDEISNYKEEVKSSILTNPEKINIDAVSLTEFIIRNELVQELDSKISQRCGFKFIKREKTYGNEFIRYIAYFGIESISELSELLKENKDNILMRIEDIAEKISPENFGGGTISRGVSLFYLTSVLISKTNNTENIRDYLISTRLATVENARDIVKELLDLGKKLN